MDAQSVYEEMVRSNPGLSETERDYLKQRIEMAAFTGQAKTLIAQLSLVVEEIDTRAHVMDAILAKPPKGDEH